MNSNHLANTPSSAGFELGGGLPFSMPSKVQLVTEITFYLELFQAYRLTQSAKWLGELLVSIPEDTSNGQGNGIQRQELRGHDPILSSKWCQGAIYYQSEVSAAVRLARVLFDAKEYRKCAFTL